MLSDLLVVTQLVLGKARIWLKTEDVCDFPGGPVDKTSPSNAGGVGLIPGQGAKLPHASQPKKPNPKTEAIL